MKYKVGDIVVVLEDEKNDNFIFLKAGEVCKVHDYHRLGKNRIQLQSLDPSFGRGIWFTDLSNIALAPEMFQVLL
jgi:hypothetical protein